MHDSMTSQLVADALMMALWRRGKPVAIIGPVESARARSLTIEQAAALRRLFAGARPLGIRKWRREDLYTRD